MAKGWDDRTSEAEALPVRPDEATRPLGAIDMAPADDGNRPIPFDADEEETEDGSRPVRRRGGRSTPWVLIASMLVAALWVAGAGVLYIREHGATGTDLQALFALAVQVLGPAAFAVLAGIMGESIAKSNREARVLAVAARRMLEPDRSAARSARLVGEAVEGEIRRLEGALATVNTRIQQIESRVGDRTAALTAASQSAKEGATDLARTMEDERSRLDALVRALSDLTQTASVNTRAAAEGLEAHAAHLTAATDRMRRRSDEAVDAASDAADRLDAATTRAVQAVSQLDEAAQRGEAALARAHDMMVLARIRADEAMAGLSQIVQSLQAAAETATGAASQAAGAVDAGARSLRESGLVALEEIRASAEAAGREIAASLRAEAEAASRIGRETIEALATSAATVRGNVLETQDLVSLAIDTNTRKLDALRQATFDTARDADTFTENRIRDARALVEHSAGMLDETGTRVAERFQAVAASAADQARAIEDLLDGLTRRLAALPEEAGARAAALERELSSTLSKITDNGRRAAEEAALLDAAFQERLRASYAAMGELVMRLGGVAGLPSQLPPLPVAAAARLQPEPTPAPVTEPRSDAAPGGEPVAEAGPDSGRERLKLRGLVEVAEAAAVSVDAATQPTAPSAKPTGTALEDQQQSVPPSQTETGPDELPSTGRISDPVLPSSGGATPDPYAGIDFSRPGGTGPVTGGAWRWRDVLSSIDEGGRGRSEADEPPEPASNVPAGATSAAQPVQGGADGNTLRELVIELRLGQDLPDTMADRLKVLAARGKERSRLEVGGLVPDAVRLLRNRMRRDPALRARLVRFVETRREGALRGRLVSDELRLYLVADAALDG